MGYALGQTLFSLFELCFDLYITCVILRFLLQWVKADFYNPFCQAIVRVTNPLLLPLRRFIPGIWGLDISAIALALILKGLELILLSLFIDLYVLSLDYLWIIPLALLQLTLDIFFFAIILRSILSWINPGAHHPLGEILTQLTDLLLSPIREKIPPFAGFDISPAIVLIAILLVSNFLHLWLGM